MVILPIDSGRYGSKEIKKIFEEQKRLDFILEFEAATALSQSSIGIIPPYASEEINIQAKSGKITLSRVKELESTTDHDMAAVVNALSEQCSPDTKPWVHFGLTSNDIIDTTTSMQLRDALLIIEPKIKELARILSEKSVKYKNQPAVGRTHGQHASIIPFGLKFAVWAIEMIKHLERIKEGKKRFLICKTLGVVGTGSLMGNKALEVQQIVASLLNLYPIDAATQVIPRERLAEVQFLIALIGTSLDKIAIEIRNLQRTEIDEVAESFKSGQMGSSAVPVKRNPIKSERVSSLAKLLRSLLNVSMENISLWHERDLTNSANERFTIPMGTILLDEMLTTMIKVVKDLSINIEKISSNLNITKGQIYAEFVLESLVKKGIPRIEAYRDIQRVAFEAKESSKEFIQAIKDDPVLSKNFSERELADLFTPEQHFASAIQIIENVSSIVQNELSFST
ncbi:MAG TPA: adenylosuccinate lyase [Nitrososphaeraceae archaeon]|jgi:adenylosuccinate lyase|nr:adenylosuccinate lyase [Nitrososphaeraceae archaeon]